MSREDGEMNGNEEHTGIPGPGGLRAVRIPPRFGGGFKLLQDGEEEFTLLMSELRSGRDGMLIRFSKFRCEVVLDGDGVWKAVPRDEEYFDFTTQEEYERWAKNQPSEQAAMAELDRMIAARRAAGRLASPEKVGTRPKQSH